MTLPADLRPLASLALRHPDLEGQVVWQENGAYTVQDAEDLGLDAEEIAYYAEGLLMEGFHLVWSALAEVEDPRDPVILQLVCAEGQAPVAPPVPEGWCLSTVSDAAGRAAPPMTPNVR